MRMTAWGHIIKSHINRDGIKVIDELKIESIDFPALTIRDKNENKKGNG